MWIVLKNCFYETLKNHHENIINLKTAIFCNKFQNLQSFTHQFFEEIHYVLKLRFIFKAINPIF